MLIGTHSALYCGMMNEKSFLKGNAMKFEDLEKCGFVISGSFGMKNVATLKGFENEISIRHNLRKQLYIAYIRCDVDDYHVSYECDNLKGIFDWLNQRTTSEKLQNFDFRNSMKEFGKLA